MTNHLEAGLSVRGALAIFIAMVVLASSADAQRSDFSGPPALPAAHISITFENGRIAGTIRDASLQAVLPEIASRTGVALVPADDVELERSRVSVELTGVALDEGLRRLLADYDTFFYYAAAGSGASSLRTVWIYRKGAAAALRPVPPEAWAGTNELAASLADADPEVRARTYEALIARPTPQSRELVLHALRGTSETDSTVRERILSSAFSSGMQLPADLLMYLARWDAHEGIRLVALDGLALEPTFKEAAQAALTDPSPRIRKRAKQILAELESR
jgi:hypothetical protein